MKRLGMGAERAVSPLQRYALRIYLIRGRSGSRQVAVHGMMGAWLRLSRLLSNLWVANS